MADSAPNYVTSGKCSCEAEQHCVHCSSMMDLPAALGQLAAVERSMERLYLGLRDLYSDDDDASTFFDELATEENHHAELVDFELRNSAERDDMAVPVRFDPVRVQRFTVRVDAFLRCDTKPSLEHAIEFALSVESDAMEDHYRNALICANRRLAPFLRGMQDSDEKHAARLRQRLDAIRGASSEA